MYGLSMFNTSFKAEEVPILYASTSSAQGALSAPDINPVGGFVCARLELSPNAYNKLIFAYDPKNCSSDGSICFDAGKLHVH